MKRSSPRTGRLVAWAVSVIVAAGVVYAMVDLGARLSDVERDRDYQRRAAQSIVRLVYATQDSTLRELTTQNGLKGTNGFVYGVVEVHVDSTWSQVVDVRW